MVATLPFTKNVMVFPSYLKDSGSVENVSLSVGAPQRVSFVQIWKVPLNRQTRPNGLICYVQSGYQKYHWATQRLWNRSWMLKKFQDLGGS